MKMIVSTEHSFHLHDRATTMGLLQDMYMSINTTSRDGRTLTLCIRVRQQPCSSLDDAGVVIRSQFIVYS